MNAIDGTDHYEKTAQGPPPALLAIVLDTNPHAWSVLSPTISLFSAVANLLVFINAHLACNNANKVAIIASHCQRTQWLYPTPSSSSIDRSKRGAKHSSTAGMNGDTTTSRDHDMEEKDSLSDANKYRPFRIIEEEVMANIRHLIDTTTPEELQSTTTTMIAGALTLALNYINKATISTASTGNASAPTTTSTFDPTSTTTSTTSPQQASLHSRILIVSVSGDLADQYIPIMNTIFAAQRLNIPIDILKLAGDTVFLQQASDATNGVYLAPSTPQGLLQYLMLGFLHDQSARKHLILPKGDNVDFRAACFCHRKVVDIGFVCSICLSIFCAPVPEGVCLTCGTQLAMSNYGSVPVLVPRKKKKRKKVVGDGGGRDEATPGPS